MQPLPTPTPLPDIDPLLRIVDLPQPDLWDYTDETLQLWNTMYTNGFVLPFQVFLLLIVIFAFLMLIVKLLENIDENTK